VLAYFEKYGGVSTFLTFIWQVHSWCCADVAITTPETQAEDEKQGLHHAHDNGRSFSTEICKCERQKQFMRYTLWNTRKVIHCLLTAIIQYTF